MKQTKTKIAKKLDYLWGHMGKEKAKCEICQTLWVKDRINYTQLHPHHIVGRTHKATRWDLRNRLWCCPYHHTLGPATKIVQDNLGGWFLNWEYDDDWMGQHRLEDKRHLEKLHKVTRHWELSELEELLTNLKKAL